MKLLRLIGLMLTLLVLYVPCSFGDPITFTHQGVGSGTIGGTPFSLTTFTITAVGDTINRQSFAGGFFIDHGSASISIIGVGTFTFISGTRTFVNNSFQLVGFSRAGAGGLDLFNGPTDPSFLTWDMLTSIGPVAGNGTLLQWGISPVLTSGGQLLFNSSTSPAIFTATTGASAVPEPTTMLLLGTGLVGVAAKVGRRRKVK